MTGTMAPMSQRSVLRATAAAGGLLAVAALIPGAVLGHGVAPAPPSDPAGLLGLWSFDPTVQVPLAATVVAWVAAVRRVNREHPSNPVPRRRSVGFLLGIGAIELALQSPIERYDTTLFSVHMVQHLLLTMVAAPLIAYGAPITLLLRVAPGDVRRRWIIPVLHSRVMRALTHPVVAWLLFAGVMWGTHFSPVFNESLENPLLHQLEHLLYLGSALLFWWPVIGADPSPWRLPYPMRALYTFLQMPQNTFLALAIYSTTTVRYAHYATLQRNWGPDPLADQQLAGGLMWVGGDLIFLVAILFVVRGWMRQEDRDAVRVDARQDAEREEISRREVILAERLARERGQR
jgi:cytochrome c oxidase assembly factor CtaG